jgi:hypothetical protein
MLLDDGKEKDRIVTFDFTDLLGLNTSCSWKPPERRTSHISGFCGRVQKVHDSLSKKMGTAHGQA